MWDVILALSYVNQQHGSYDIFDMETYIANLSLFVFIRLAIDVGYQYVSNKCVHCSAWEELIVVKNWNPLSHNYQ